MNYILFLTVLPTIIMGRYIYKNDKIEKEPTNLLVKLLVSGVLAAGLTIILNLILINTFPFFANEMYEEYDLLSLAVYVFVGIALVEEFSKWLFTYIIAWRNKAFDHVYDAIVYSTFVSLGFATFENILYVFGSENLITAISTAIARMLLSVPGHAFFGVMMGYYLGLAKLTSINNIKYKSQKYLILSILVPTFCHFMFDYLLMVEFSGSMILFLVYVIILFAFGMHKVKRMSNIPTMLFNDPNRINCVYNAFGRPLYVRYCSNCGKLLSGPYCSNCGKKCI